MHLPVEFIHPALLALAALALPVIWLRGRRQPTVLHSRVSIQKNLRGFPVLGWLPGFFLVCLFLAVAGAIARPVLPQVAEKRVMETRDIMIAVDISGSMGSAIPGGAPPGATAVPPPQPTYGPYSPPTPSQPQAYRRLDAAEDAVKTFVPSRKGDRVGIFAFDDETYYHWPMTDDLSIILQKADLINERMGGGTNFEGPTENDPRSGPIQAAIDHWKDYGKAKTKVLILVSDGEAPISDKRFQEIVSQMEALHGKIYMLGVGESWSDQRAASPSTEPIRKLVERLGGKCFSAADAKQMLEAMATIDSLEKSKIEVERSTTYRDVYHWFVGASIIFLVLFIGCTLLTRERA